MCSWCMARFAFFWRAGYALYFIGRQTRRPHQLNERFSRERCVASSGREAVARCPECAPFFFLSRMRFRTRGPRPLRKLFARVGRVEKTEALILGLAPAFFLAVLGLLIAWWFFDLLGRLDEAAGLCARGDGVGGSSLRSNEKNRALQNERRHLMEEVVHLLVPCRSIFLGWYLLGVLPSCSPCFILDGHELERVAFQHRGRDVG